ncbi:hypothetical protein XO10_04715 [Marinitoga sp. 1135]|uniref:Uncharacterized protein n=1 Tax=Marinitoga piezophila (strain DSM 14283 / JCM 11233 / KA3) TaxID=443254 RepID=H2J7R5_MARPK|nr:MULTISPECIES: hypothetical protein [Marinitoga]AEX85406.1 hypothetical protein Marpi_0994 [Marinitoga piezophila KA3]APT75880.1 hypothetical protein LN42_05440 [Marinitoga sp. 1137]NUU95585.1 hypothetical protein [Marinitoga sp. 1135]NUU97535.1 hypothetical protein [Marinitoga sp. 1138]
MKKVLLVFTILIISLSIFADIYQLIPENSKTVFVFHNAQKVYEDLKTVNSFGTVLDDPLYAETYAVAYIDAIAQSLEMESSDIYDAFKNNIAFFVVEPEDNNYDFGIILGPLNDGEKFVEVFKKLADTLIPTDDVNLNLSYIVKKSDLQDYLIITSNGDFYNNTKIGYTPKKRFNDTGIYEEIQTSSLNGYGFSYIKDSILYGKFYILDNIPENIKDSFNYETDNFYGLYYSKTNYIPKDFDTNIPGLNISGDTIKDILNKSNWVEQNMNMNINSDEETGEINIDLIFSLVANTGLTIKEVEDILSKNDTTYKVISDNYIKIEENVEDKELSIYIWKDGDLLYVSNKEKEEVYKFQKSKEKLSQNKVYNELKNKVPNPQFSIMFFDLKNIIKFAEDYLGISGLTEKNYGGLASAILTKDVEGNPVVEINFVMK